MPGWCSEDSSHLPRISLSLFSLFSLVSASFLAHFCLAFCVSLLSVTLVVCLCVSLSLSSLCTFSVHFFHCCLCHACLIAKMQITQNLQSVPTFLLCWLRNLCYLYQYGVLPLLPKIVRLCTLSRQLVFIVIILCVFVSAKAPDRQRASSPAAQSSLPFSYSANSQQYLSRASADPQFTGSSPTASPAPSIARGGSQHALSYAPLASSPVEDSYPAYDPVQSPDVSYAPYQPQSQFDQYADHRSGSISPSARSSGQPSYTPSYQPESVQLKQRQSRYTPPQHSPVSSTPPESNMSRVLALQRQLQSITAKSKGWVVFVQFQFTVVLPKMCVPFDVLVRVSACGRFCHTSVLRCDQYWCHLTYIVECPLWYTLDWFCPLCCAVSAFVLK